MATVARMWTVEEVHDLPDDGMRHEVIDGELFVTPAPSWSHQYVVGALYSRLSDYLRRVPAGHVIVAPADVTFGPRTAVQPDVFVVPLVDGRRPRNWAEAGKLLLAVEVLSPGTARLDRIRKRELFRREQVPDYWIIDLDARVIERWRPEDERPDILDDRIVWLPEGAAEPLSIELPSFYDEALGTAGW